MRTLLRCLIIVILILPFLSLILFIEKIGFPTAREVARATFVTVLQSTLSGLFSLFLGLWGATGILFYKTYRRPLEFFCLLPNFLPPLFVIISALNLISPFPFGLHGVIFLHTVINIGLVSVVAARLIENKVGGFAELAFVEGAPRWIIFYECVFGVLRRDLVLIFLMVFSLCFSSFAIPLVVGGTKHLTLEMLLYEKIKISGAWSEAFGLAIFESILIYLLAFLILKAPLRDGGGSKSVAFLGNAWGPLVPLACTLFVIFGLFQGFDLGLQQYRNLPQLQSKLIEVIWGSLKLSLATGFTVFGFLCLVCFLVPHKRFQDFLASYKAPSAVITAFGFVLVGLSLQAPEARMAYRWISIALALAIGFLPVLYRMECEGLLNKIENQIVSARVLGAPWSLIFCKITFPQVLGTVGFLSGIAAFWAAGDFALSGILSGEDFTLALVVQSLVGSYRLELATVLQWLVLAVGATGFFLFWSLRYVYREESA